MPTFIGLDLAWTTKNESGICWLEGDSRENLRCTRLEAAVCETAPTADEIAAIDGPVVVTIDAPVLYSQERAVEKTIARRFNKYKCPAHSPHMAYANDFTAGIDLGRALQDRNFSTYPSGLLRGDHHGRYAVEVFPHTIHVRLFGLNERLPYKRKKGRDTAYLQRAMRMYQELLRALLERECPGVLSHPKVQRALDPARSRDVIGRSLKRLDDTLDGITCAVAAWLMWKDPDGWEALGDENGYIVVPTETNTPDVVTVVPDFSSSVDLDLNHDDSVGELGVAEGEAPHLAEATSPTLIVHNKAPGIEVQVSKSSDESTWEVRVRLESDDLSRVVSVVERLE